MTARRVFQLVFVGLVGVVGAATMAATRLPHTDRSAASRNMSSARQWGSRPSVAPGSGGTTRQPVSSESVASAGVLIATWIGPATGGLWSDPANWDTVEFPSNGNGALTYDVIVMSPIFNPTVINLDINVEIGALFLRGTLDAQSDPANLIVNGLFDLQGSLLGPGTTTAKGGMIDPTLNAVITIGGGRVLENAGMATFRTPLGINIIGGAQLNNLATGTMNLQTFVLTGTDGELNNFGLLLSELCCHNTQGVFNNHGLVEVRTGSSLHLFSSGLHSGEFHVSEGATLLFDADFDTNEFTETSDIAGLGNVVFGGEETINLAGDFSMTGHATVSTPALNFASAPTSTGFALEIDSFSILSSVVSCEGGLTSLDELNLALFNELRVIGDTTISGPVMWNGVMSGTGVTTTNGLVRAVTGLTLDGRTLVANGGFLWEGLDFVLDNGAVFENADGSTWDIQLSSRRRFITTNTPLNPGRIVNSGMVSQTGGAPARVMTDWQQTPTGITNARSLSFFGNTDISGVLIVPPVRFSSPMTFAGPDNGATINHRLNEDSTLTVAGTVRVGEPFTFGGDVIGAEFAGTMDFSDPNAVLEIRGENTTVTVTGTLVNNTINSVDMDGGTLELVLPNVPPTSSTEASTSFGMTTAGPAETTIKRGSFGPGSEMKIRRGGNVATCLGLGFLSFIDLFANEEGTTILDLFQDDFGSGELYDTRFIAVKGTVTGNVDLSRDSGIDLTEGTTVKVDGANVFVGNGVIVGSSDGTGRASANNAEIQLAESTDPATPSQTIEVPFVATNSNVTASCPTCPGRPHAQFLAGLTLEGNSSFNDVDVTVQPGLTIGPGGVWTLNNTNVLTGVLDNETVMSLVLSGSTLAIQVLDSSSASIDGNTLTLIESQVRFLDADGTSEVGSLSGIITLSKDNPNNSPQNPLVVTVNSFVSTTTVKSGTVLAPGDTSIAFGSIGTATISSDEIVLESGSVLEVEIIPTRPVIPNDLLQFFSNTTTFGANLEISLPTQSECDIGPADPFTVVTGSAISFTNGGDGRRILTIGGEGSFVVNQGPTGIFLDQFQLSADLNGDRAVDEADTQVFIPCLAGPGEPHSPKCVASDLDFDTDADLKDFSVLQNRFGTNCQ